MQNQAGYMALKRDLQEKFMDYGLKTVIQGFWPNIPVSRPFVNPFNFIFILFFAKLCLAKKR